MTQGNHCDVKGTTALIEGIIKDAYLKNRGAIHKFLRIIFNLRIPVLLSVSTLPYVVRVKNSS
jgi:hypothetical protein